MDTFFAHTSKQSLLYTLCELFAFQVMDRKRPACISPFLSEIEALWHGYASRNLIIIRRVPHFHDMIFDASSLLLPQLATPSMYLWQ